MNPKIQQLGLKLVQRPKIKPKKQLDLTGLEGQQIVLSETKLVLRTHAKTFKKLADM
ncbi:acetyltransferase [Alishewanella sp. d11]|uniref:acetyltransferase n=1 Tax=Alishewanella sp. d11 TaxID=3414030 RepID=UPI003BF8B8D4